MPCAECENTVCTCGGLCFCCPNACLCVQCVHVRQDQPSVECPSVGGGRCSHSSKSDLGTQHQSSGRSPDERRNTGSVAEATRGSSMASPGYDFEMSCRSPPTISPTFDDTLIFPMEIDDIDFPPRNPMYAKMASMEAEKRLLFPFTSASGTRPLKQCEPTSRSSRSDHRRVDTANLKSTDSYKCKRPISVPRLKEIDTSLKESRQSEIPVTTQDVARCSCHSLSTSITKMEKSPITGVSPLRTDSVTAIKDSNGSKLRQSRKEVPIKSQDVDECLRNNPHVGISEMEQSQVTRVSPSRTCAATHSDRPKLEKEMEISTQGVPGCSQCNPIKTSKSEESQVADAEHKLNVSSLKWTESPESEMMISKDIPGCSHKCTSKQEESRITDSASETVSSSADEYASESLPSMPSSSSSVRLRSPPSSCSGSEMIPQDIPCCSHKCISKQEESQITDSASEAVSSSADEYASESLSSIPSSSSSVHLRSPPSSCSVCGLIPQDIPGCSHKCISKQEEYQITDSSLEAVSSSADEYASESLPSIPSSSSSVRLRSPPSSFSASPQSPPLSSSAPSIYDLPEFVEFKSSEQKQSATLNTSKESLTSDLSKSETLISDSHNIDKSRTSSESSSSIEVIPEDIPKVEQPDIPSNSAESSEVNDGIIQAESTQPGTSQPLSNSL